MSKSQLNELNTPKLRFKGFAKEWRSENLVNMAEFIQGITYNKENEDINGKYFVLRANNIYNSNLLLENLIKINVNVKNNKYFIQENDVLISTNSGSKNLLGKSCIINSIFKNYLIGGFMMVARNYEPIIPYLLTTRKWFNEITLDDTSTIYSISKSKLSRIKFFIPNNDEQQKIAEFFVILDKQIKLWERKLQLNELIKQYYLNQLFIHSICVMVPKLRFKEFNEEWSIKELGSLLNISTGNKDLKDKVDNGPYPFYVRSKKIEHIDEFAHDCKALLIPGDGRIGDIIHYAEGKFNFHQRVYALINSSEDIKYIYYEFQINLKKHLLGFSAKATVDSIRLPMLQKYNLFIPTNYEQQKIAKFFTLLDNNIKLCKENILINNSKKQYFLSKLFI